MVCSGLGQDQRAQVDDADEHTVPVEHVEVEEFVDVMVIFADEAERLGDGHPAAQTGRHAVHDAAGRVLLVLEERLHLVALLHLLEQPVDHVLVLDLAQEIGGHVRFHGVEDVGQRLHVEMLGDFHHLFLIQLLEDAGQFLRSEQGGDMGLLRGLQVGDDLGAVGRVQPAQIGRGRGVVAALEQLHGARQRIADVDGIDHVRPLLPSRGQCSASPCSRCGRAILPRTREQIARLRIRHRNGAAHTRVPTDGDACLCLVNPGGHEPTDRTGGRDVECPPWYLRGNERVCCAVRRCENKNVCRGGRRRKVGESGDAGTGPAAAESMRRSNLCRRDLAGPAHTCSPWSAAIHDAGHASDQRDRCLCPRLVPCLVAADCAPNHTCVRPPIRPGSWSDKGTGLSGSDGLSAAAVNAECEFIVLTKLSSAT